MGIDVLPEPGLSTPGVRGGVKINYRSAVYHWGLLALAMGLALVGAAGRAGQPATGGVFDLTKKVIFQDDFQSGLGQWKLAIDASEDRAALDKAATKKRVHIVAAPDSPPGRKAVCCVMPRAVGSFRSEIALPHEEGFQERWYGARIYVPADWVFDGGGDIVLQWHGLLGDEKKARGYPPLSIAIMDDRWRIHRAFGPPDDIQRDARTLDDPVQKGRWVAWVVHVCWSSGTDGHTQIWKDGKVVWDVKGPNTYLMRPLTPYFKTGLYHPSWKKKNEDKFNDEKTAVTVRTIYTADIKIGGPSAGYEDVAPQP